MTDKVTHYDYKAIPRTAFDKRAVKKGATGQSFIRKEITTYRIATLEASPCAKVLKLP